MTMSEKKEGYPCAVVRDLMPLEIDGIASPQSEQAVHEHMEGCEACRTVYARMRADVGEAERPEVMPLRDVMHQLWRRLSVRVTAVVLAVLVLIFGVIHPWLSSVQKTVPLRSIDRDSVQVVVENGQVDVRFDTACSEDDVSCWSMRTDSDPAYEGGTALYLSVGTGLYDWLQNRLLDPFASQHSTQEIHISDTILWSYQENPDGALTAIYYVESENSWDGEGELIWRADAEQYPEMTFKVLMERVMGGEE